MTFFSIRHQRSRAREYAKAYNEVMTVGSHKQHTATSRSGKCSAVLCGFVANSGVQSGRRAGRHGTGPSLSENARALALINMAMSDSLVASFLNKYAYKFWRPETAIHAGDTDGNPKTAGDPSWAPFITTPCFPSYPSNHGSAATARPQVLRHIYGEDGHSITLTNPAVPTIVLQYTSFKQITDDISDARVYGGIHFRTDQRAGERLGKAVGAKSTSTTCVACTTTSDWL